MTYKQKLLALIATGRLRGGEVHRLEIAHDDGCPRLKGGECKCEPDLILDGKKLKVPQS